jgi:hypothetical protein
MLKLKQSDGVRLRQLVEVAIKEALEEFMGVPSHQRVLSSNIEHTQLYPTGDAFQIQLRVEIHERPQISQEPN